MAPVYTVCFVCYLVLSALSTARGYIRAVYKTLSFVCHSWPEAHQPRLCGFALSGARSNTRVGWFNALRGKGEGLGERELKSVLSI